MLALREMTGQTYKNVYAGTPDTVDVATAGVVLNPITAAAGHRNLIEIAPSLSPWCR